MFVVKIIMSDKMTSDDQGVNEAASANETITLRAEHSDPESIHQEQNETCQVPPDKETAAVNSKARLSDTIRQFVGCRCRRCSAAHEKEKAGRAVKPKNEVTKSPLADEPQGPEDSWLCIEEMQNKHDPECGCRDCTYEANEFGWELVEECLQTKDDPPREEFCNLQELIGICIELDEKESGGNEN